MNTRLLVLGLAVAASLCSTAKANLIMNGSFELNGYTPPFPPGTTHSITNPGTPSNDHGQITNWTVVSGLGSPSTFWNAIYVYDNYSPNPPPSDSSSSPTPAPMPASYRSCDPLFGFQSGAQCLNPDGPGYFVNLDGDPGFPTAINQTISGLEINKLYRLTFSWAAVQRDDASGPTSDEYLTVSLGNQSFDTTNIFTGTPSPTCTLQLDCLPSKGFSGWFTSSFDFLWDGTSSNTVLTFLAHGNPGGLPPSLNLDGISLNAVPEPSIWALVIIGIGLLTVELRRRRQTGAAG